MPRLDILSKINKLQYPFIFLWDSEYRKNHATYQKKIDEITFHLQKSQRSWGIFGKWNQPFSYQRDLLILDLQKHKQWVGKVFPEEVNWYKEQNSSISYDLYRTFNNKLQIPWKGLAIGSGLLGFGALFNFSYAYRAFFFAFPLAADMAHYFVGTSSQANSLNFLKWVLEQRKARGRLEFDCLDAKQIKDYRSIVKSNLPVYDIYEEIIKLSIENAIKK